ncbi:hypothetical protein MMC30_000124 [Trapelia coarctata]|nr:hypothetical protein [Trapelia coarctata]
MATVDSGRSGTSNPPHSSLSSLPVEVQLLVFGGLGDLDDALALSRTCSYCLRLFRGNKHAIARAIVLSSDVYKYDLCVVNFIAACSSLAEIYRRHGSDLTLEQRPSEVAFLQCSEPRLCTETLTDELLNRICLHWENTRIFRTLYLDASVAAEYEVTRNRIACDDPIMPVLGFTMLSNDWLQAGSNRGSDHTFKGRFHKALCLNTIATLAHTLGKATFPVTVEGTLAVELLTWTTRNIVIADTQIPLTPEEMIDCMEVYDFLYLFMLPKLLPLKKIQTWAKESSGLWSLGYSVGLGREENFQYWSFFLFNCRLFLQPLDLAALFSSQSWRSGVPGMRIRYPPNMEFYMLERGCYDSGADIRDKWQTDEWDRRLIVDGLDWVILSDGIDLSYYGDGPDQRRWWDRIRAKSGSPFRRSFSFKAWLVCEGMRNNM